LHDLGHNRQDMITVQKSFSVLPFNTILQDEYRVEMNSRRITELESVHNNVRLLSEMLDQYQLGQTSAEELELIKELHQSCERLRPSVFRLVSETQDNESMLSKYEFSGCEGILKYAHTNTSCFHNDIDILLNDSYMRMC
jgi:transcription-repair coupling factor (superfamily II helicase)